MKLDRALPFRTLSSAALKMTPWACSVNGAEPSYNPSQLSKWDYASEVKIWRQVQIDFEVAARCLEIPKDELSIVVQVSLGTGTGAMPRRTWPAARVMVDKSSPSAEINFSINSKDLSTRITLGTNAILAGSHKSTSPLSPKALGARLWSDHHDIFIEGEAPRFPISEISFKRAFVGRRHSDSPWYVHWSTIELDRDLSGTLRLFINMDSSAFSERIKALDGPTLQAIMYDVMSQVIGRYLDSTIEERPELAFEPGSIGYQAVQWMSLAFPGQSIEQVRALRDARPGDYSAGVLSAAEMSEL